MVRPNLLQLWRLVLASDYYPAEVDGVDDHPDKHSNKSLIIGAVGPYIHSRSHSFLASLGQQTWILLLDCRLVLRFSS